MKAVYHLISSVCYTGAAKKMINSLLCITSFLRCVTPTPEVIVDFSMLCITSFLRCVTPDFGKVIDYKKIESDFVSGNSLTLRTSQLPHLI